MFKPCVEKLTDLSRGGGSRKMKREVDMGIEEDAHWGVMTGTYSPSVASSLSTGLFFKSTNSLIAVSSAP